MTSPRERVLEAAASDFYERGYSATTHASIADRLGVTRSRVQHHIPSKSMAAVEIAWRPFQGGAFGQDSRPATGGVATIRLFVLDIATRYRDDVFLRASTRLMTERALIPDSDLPVPYVPWLTPCRALVVDAIARRELDAGVDPDVLALQLVSGFVGTRMLLEIQGSLRDFPAHAATHTDALLSAAGARC